MQRKIACILTAIITVVFMILRTLVAKNPDFSVGNISVEDLMIGIALVTMGVIVVLCYSKKATVSKFNDSLQPTIGWIATFVGAVLAMSSVLDALCWLSPAVSVSLLNNAAYNQQILNNVDLYSLVLSIIFGIGSGVYLIIQGFNWMSKSEKSPTWLFWLGLSPVIWMWFRLARYEISYASTIDISHSFFDFAVLVTSALFFLQLAKAISEVEAAPKNLLIVFSLFTTLCGLSGAPLLVNGMIEGTSIMTILTSIVDTTIGLLSFIIAITQVVYEPAQEASSDCSDETITEDAADEDGLAWTTPAKARKPLDPPFAIDELLPVLEESKTDTNASSADSQQSSMTVDDILAELNLTDDI